MYNNKNKIVFIVSKLRLTCYNKNKYNIGIKNDNRYIMSI